jgi:hypothetical protein
VNARPEAPSPELMVSAEIVDVAERFYTLARDVKRLQIKIELLEDRRRRELLELDLRRADVALGSADIHLQHARNHAGL